MRESNSSFRVSREFAFAISTHFSGFYFKFLDGALAIRGMIAVDNSMIGRCEGQFSLLARGLICGGKAGFVSASRGETRETFALVAEGTSHGFVAGVSSWLIHRAPALDDEALAMNRSCAGKRRSISTALRKRT